MTTIFASGRIMNIFKATASAATFMFAAGAAHAQSAKIIETKEVSVQVETVADGLSYPWSVEVLPDGAYLVTEKPGRLVVIRDGKISQPIEGLPDIATGSQGGLLDVALDPKFRDNRTIYFTASVEESAGRGLAVFRAELSKDERELSKLKRIFLMNKLTSGSMQYGSRIAIADNGSLFVSVGDRRQQDRAQDYRDDAGSIVHINADGSIPSDNPFKDGKKALPEIWSKGHRNPDGIAFDPQTHILYTAEHGAMGGDEINNPQAGKNYGWPIITYGRDYDGSKIGVGTAKEGMEQPLFYWDPSIAPGAIAIYRGKMFPEWNGDFLVAALKFKLVSRLVLGKNGRIEERERMFKGDYGRLRDIVVAPDGALLITTDDSNGKLLRVSRAP